MHDQIFNNMRIPQIEYSSSAADSDNEGIIMYADTIEFIKVIALTGKHFLLPLRAMCVSVLQDSFPASAVWLLSIDSDSVSNLFATLVFFPFVSDSQTICLQKLSEWHKSQSNFMFTR